MKEFTMKFNKSFLFATIIASFITLTACNDKEQKQAEKPTVETTQPAVEKLNPQQKLHNQQPPNQNNRYK